MKTKTPQQVTLSIEELQQTLEILIRRVVREELTSLSQQVSNIFYLTPDMPLYEDMEEIAHRKAVDDIELYSHDVVWNE